MALTTGEQNAVQRSPTWSQQTATQRCMVTNYLEEEVILGCIIGPLPPEQIPRVHISSMGVIPKGHQPGKWRLIVDLSSPHGKSINDGISSELASLSYISIDKIAGRVASMGRGTLLAKMDIHNAYRMVPVHPENRVLLHGDKMEGNGVCRHQAPLRVMVCSQDLYSSC